MKSAVDLYDYIYSWKDYTGEADIIHKILSSHGCAKGTLLELACGTGRYIENWSMYDCYGVDLCSRSIELASRRNPRAHWYCTDMKDTKLTMSFDAIVCLFGGIAYLSEEELQIALTHWYSLLKDDGILIVEPWLEKKQIDFDKPFLQTYQTLNLKIARMVVPKELQGCCELNFSFLVSRAGFKVELFECQDRLWLYSRTRIQKKIEAAGFRFIESRESFLAASNLLIFNRPSSF
ncbi:MAG: class I SAM-dependent methyltransferase [Myxococcota bacterium]|nr:class I SAM-dependent methyltransferase [Myxococcota bacterium]